MNLDTDVEQHIHDVEELGHFYLDAQCAGRLMVQRDHGYGRRIVHSASVTRKLGLRYMPCRIRYMVQPYTQGHRICGLSILRTVSSLVR